jgi:putative nucleotidyltransferase with HDIG domain
LIFEGELSRFHPEDILMFLSHLGSSGVLSVAYDSQTLTVSLKDGMLVDANSNRGDDKILKLLLYRKIIDHNQFNHIVQVRRETGMSVNQILVEIKLDRTPAVKDVLVVGIKEVLLEFFLLESGEFHFTDVMMDGVPDAAAFDCRSISLEIISYVDEWRDIEKNLLSLENSIRPTAAVRNVADLSDLEKKVIGRASKNLTTLQVITSLPYLSCQGLKAVENLFLRKLLELQPSPESQPKAVEEPVTDQLFFSFKRAYKKIISTDDIRKKLSAVVTFCKDYFQQILVLTANDLQILQCTVVTVGKNGSIQQKNIKETIGRLDEDPGFYAVYRSGIGFLGKVYPSSLLQGLIDLPTSGECAIIPVGKQKDVSIVLYVVTSDEQRGLNAFHYLELLSWLIGPPVEDINPSDQTAVPMGLTESPKIGAEKTQAPPVATDRIQLLVDKIEELPPLPSLVFQIHELLADPDFSMDKLEELIGQDQSLVAKLIKVSNSVLYGGVGEVGSLRQALTRLGTRTVKSLVLATSTRTFFSKKQSATGISSQLLWQHSVECGLAARRVARKVGYSDPDEAFVGGVLHDIGKLVMLLKLPDEYRKVQKMKKSEGANELALESEVLGCDHAEIGDKLMKKWKMPPSLRACVQMHHRFKEPGDDDLLVPIVAYGNYLAHTCGAQAESNQMESQADIDALVIRLQLTEEQNKALKDEIIEDYQNNNLFE